MNEHDDRRHNARVSFHATGDLEFADQKFSGCETENLSTKGVLMLGIPARALGDTCTVSLHLSGTSDDITLTMQGEVVRLEDKGVGVHFTEIDLDSYTHLRNIIYYNTEDPDALKEFSFEDE
ncbi:MAG: PilZ domain-containing protein [Proteobacteria bacterium]|nr:PilZ domain-containing protein [Pseudomonadota bacterium]MBU1639808.1 PilZ domain-containing protein [Pseudomonadota bacterium]